MKRWVCEGGHPGVNAPSRMRKNDIRRFCWACSQKTGVLVERSCPALEKKRAAKKPKKKAAPKARPLSRKAKQERRATLERARAEQPAGSVQNPWAELNRLQNLPCVQAAFAASERPRVTELNVRRRSKGTYVTGRSYNYQPRIAVTVPVECRVGQVEDLLAHELAHSCLPISEHHGPAWKDMYLAILSEGYGLDTPWPGSMNGYFSTGYGYDYHKAVQCIETQLRQLLTKNCAPGHSGRSS